MQIIYDAITGLGGRSTRVRAEKLRHRFFSAYANNLFESIHNGFMMKSRGQADDLGEKWAPLAPGTIAARPITRQDIQKYHIHPQRTRGLLSPKEDALWRKIFKRRFDELFQGTMSHDEAKAAAAKYAWWWLKTLGAKTRKDTLGKRSVPILIETERLEKSLRPGKFFKWSYRPFNADQIFEIRGQALVVGSRVPYARFHQTGTRRHPPRPPIPAAKVMQPWTTKAARSATWEMASFIEEVL